MPAAKVGVANNAFIIPFLKAFSTISLLDKLNPA